MSWPKNPTTEVEFVAAIERCRKYQERMENEQAEAIVNRDGETCVNAIGRKANQALFQRRKFQKQLDDLRTRTTETP